MVLLILESFGSTELLFILVMALIFFGPRKLPQISRSLGKSMAEFRRASEDFKRTWEREVAMENSPADGGVNETSSVNENILFESESVEPNRIAALPGENAVARQTRKTPADVDAPEPLSKRDWL